MINKAYYMFVQPEKKEKSANLMEEYLKIYEMRFYQN